MNCTAKVAIYDDYEGEYDECPGEGYAEDCYQVNFYLKKETKQKKNKKRRKKPGRDMQKTATR